MNLLKNAIFAILFSAISFSVFADFKLSIKNKLEHSSIISVGIGDTVGGGIEHYEKINSDNPLLPKKSSVIATKLNVSSLSFGAQGQVRLSASIFLQCTDAEHHQCEKPNWYLGSNPLITPILNTVPVVIGSEIFETTRVILILKNVGKQTDSPIKTPPYLQVDYRVIRKSTTTNAVNRTNGTLGYIHVFIT